MTRRTFDKCLSSLMVAVLSPALPFAAEPASSLDSATVVADSLRRQAVASWNFNEGQGDTLHDQSGHGHHGVIQDAEWVQGIEGHGLQFEGRQSIVVPADSTLENTSFTFSIWLKQSGNGLRGPLMEFQPPNGMVGVHLWANTNGNTVNLPGSFYGNIRRIDAASGQSGSYRDNLLNTEAGVAPGGRWNHVVLTHDHATHTTKLYMNGRLQAAETFPEFVPRTLGNLWFGMRDSTSLDWDNGVGLIGTLDRADLFDIALSALEVARLYGSPVGELGSVHLGMKTHYSQPGDTVIVPIYLSSTGQDSLSSLQFNLRFDTSVVRFSGVQLDTTLASGWRLTETLPDSTGAIRMAAAGLKSLAGPEEGVFVALQFIARSDLRYGASTMLTLEKILIDEGRHPFVTHTPGKIFVVSPDLILGDVDADSQVTLADAKAILRHVVGTITTPNDSFPNLDLDHADVSGNGTISSYDAALVLQFSLGMLEHFPTTSVRSLAKRALWTDGRLKLSDPILLGENRYRFLLTGETLAGLLSGEIVMNGMDVVSAPVVKSLNPATRIVATWQPGQARASTLKLAFSGNRKLANAKTELFELEAEGTPGLPPLLELNSASLNEGLLGTLNHDATAIHHGRTRQKESGHRPTHRGYPKSTLKHSADLDALGRLHLNK
jgi:Concanavalin A-like lectin/glucanases superfamily/Cohesin domain/Dockerin type I domain